MVAKDRAEGQDAMELLAEHVAAAGEIADPEDLEGSTRTPSTAPMLGTAPSRSTWPMAMTWDAVAIALDLHEARAWASLARYKFLMFGYHAAVWVTLNKLRTPPKPNPWKNLVHTAKVERLVPQNRGIDPAKSRELR